MFNKLKTDNTTNLDESSLLGHASDTTLALDVKCHICKKIKPCLFCSVCNHWFCKECKSKIFTRGIEAIKELLGGPTPNCCGPEINMNKIKTNNTTQKNFSYKKGDVNLSFTLRTDIKTELKDFVEILKVAIKEVEEEIKK